ncbi:MAG: tripartite tricarboxylate transporter substrate binding protein [Burkholderiales bacterium]
MTIALLRMVLGAIAIGGCAPAYAQEVYPARAVRVVVPFAPGGGVDISARAIAAKLSERFGQNFTVDNRPGAGGNVGTEVVSKARPDGYTLLITSSSYVINQSLYKLAYDPIDGFAPITLISQQPFVVALHPSVPADNIRDLIALARSRPAALSYASAGAGGTQHLSAELFKSLAGVDIIHIPYKGTGPALNDVLAGQVEMTFGSLLASLPHVKAGRLKAIAVTGAARLEGMPDIPTVDESGLPGYTAASWYAALAPARTPQAIVKLLNRETVIALQTPEVKSRFTAEGSTVVASTPEQLAARVKHDLAKWEKVIRQANIRLDASR